MPKAKRKSKPKTEPKLVTWLPAVAIARMFERLTVARGATMNVTVARELNMCLLRLQGETFPGMCSVCGCSLTHACRLPNGGVCRWVDKKETLCNNPECLAAIELAKAAKVVTKHVVEGSPIPHNVQEELAKLKTVMQAAHKFARGSGGNA